MKYRKFENIEKPVSLFGLGCMRFNGEASGDSVIDEEKAIKLIRKAIDGGVNYIDTAYVYLDRTAEGTVGKALRDGYREKVTIATKMPIDYVKTPEDMENLFSSELKSLETDHIDFYLLHALGKDRWDRFKELGVKDFLNQKKAEGKIKYKCFSFHGPYEEFEYILNDFDWDMVQIQYNFMDINNQAGTKGLKLAASKGIPVVIMEGLLGGKLSKAPDDVQAIYDEFPIKRSPVEWAFRWLANNPEILTILSGCNEEEQIEDNLKIFDEVDAGLMTDAEMELIAKVRDAYNARTKISCTGCRYCMPCPNDVAIPRVFNMWNEYGLYNANPLESWDYLEIKEAKQTPENCIECGKCESACPQHLNIIEALKTSWSEMIK